MWKTVLILISMVLLLRWLNKTFYRPLHAQSPNPNVTSYLFDWSIFGYRYTIILFYNNHRDIAHLRISWSSILRTMYLSVFSVEYFYFIVFEYTGKCESTHQVKLKMLGFSWWDNGDIDLWVIKLIGGI